MSGVLLLLLALARPGGAEVSSGGAYTLEQSALASGGAAVSGGEFALASAAGDASASAPGARTRRSGAGGEDLRSGLFNPPPMSMSSATVGVVGTPDGALLAVVPPGANGEKSFDLVLRRDPVTRPVMANPDLIDDATRKFNANSNGVAPIDRKNIWELNVMNEEGFVPAVFAKPVQLAFAYSDPKNQHPKSLAVWTMDPATARWVKVPGSHADATGGQVFAAVSHFSVYAVLAQADEDVADAYAFPVPFRPNGTNAGTGPGQTGAEYQPGVPLTGITFTNLPSEGAIEIYTLSGQLVRRIDIPATLGVFQLQWDVRNGAGQAVVSGVYIWKVASQTSHKTGRLMVIR
ncbi:MAG: T9SS type A sorting domain-containing protein [Elusimicrobia bacterium]|nr:T9SS type A sorting domain-containing protein [Elusimicrobiota bacterium]